MSHEEIKAASDKALKSIIATMNPDGAYGQSVRMAKTELDERGVDYSDCLEPTR